MVPGGRRRSGALHDDMAQGRGGDELATRIRRRQHRRQGEIEGTGERRGRRTDAAVDECRNELVIVWQGTRSTTKCNVCDYSPEPYSEW